MTGKFGNRTIQFRPHIFNVICELAKVSNLNAVVNDLLEHVIGSPELLGKIKRELQLGCEMAALMKEADSLHKQYNSMMRHGLYANAQLDLSKGRYQKASLAKAQPLKDLLGSEDFQIIEQIHELRKEISRKMFANRKELLGLKGKLEEAKGLGRRLEPWEIEIEEKMAFECEKLYRAQYGAEDEQLLKHAEEQRFKYVGESFTAWAHRQQAN